MTELLLEADVELVPIVGADNAGFVQQLLDVEGLEGAAVTNSAAVGGAGVTLALQILKGEEPAFGHAHRGARLRTFFLVTQFACSLALLASGFIHCPKLFSPSKSHPK